MVSFLQPMEPIKNLFLLRYTYSFCSPTLHKVTEKCLSHKTTTHKNTHALLPIYVFVDFLITRVEGMTISSLINTLPFRFKAFIKAAAAA